MQGADAKSAVGRQTELLEEWREQATGVPRPTGLLGVAVGGKRPQGPVLLPEEALMSLPSC